MAVGAGRPASTKEPQRRVVMPVSGVTTLFLSSDFESLCTYKTVNGLFINKIFSSSPPRLGVRLSVYSDEDQTLRAHALNILGLNACAHSKYLYYSVAKER